VTIELDVHLGSKQLERAAVYQAIVTEWSERFGSPGPEFVADTALPDTIGSQEESVRCVVGDFADVQCMCFTPGSVEELQHAEGGWWLDIMIVDRTKESYLLMLLVSACVARLLDQPIRDDIPLLGYGRDVDYDTVLAELDKVKGKSASEAALIITQKYNSALAEY
jgi:hypothetical protein